MVDPNGFLGQTFDVGSHVLRVIAFILVAAGLLLLPVVPAQIADRKGRSALLFYLLGLLLVVPAVVLALLVPARQGVPTRGRRPPITYAFRAIIIAYLLLLVAWPVSLVAYHTFEDGTGAITELLSDPQVQHALRLTVVVALSAVVINTVFGVGISLLLVRYRFPGKRVLSPLLDLPLSVSPVVVGLSLILVYGGRDGWFGPWLEDIGIQIIFSTPGIIMATTFVALPLVIREVVPVLEEVGIEQEQAAHSLGAGPLQTFRRITLPSIRWALVYGVVLSLARSLGEFGAVKVVSGNVLGRTRTATLVVEEKYLNFDKPGAYATAFLLAMVSVACIVIVGIIRPKESQRS